jgi:MFS family permease
MSNSPSNHESGSIYTEPKQGLENDAPVPGAVKLVHADGFVDYVDKKAIGGDVEGMPRGYFRSPQFIGTIMAQCFGSIVAYLGWVLPANTLSLINADLGNSKDINWVATVWTLGSCIGFLIVGRLSDIFGRKWMVQSSMALSLVGCIIGCLAKSVHMLIAANLLNGLAAAGQLSFGIVMGELVPNRLRGPVITVVFLSSLPFAVFGPVIARSFIDHTAAKWRWSYYLGIIFSGLTMILYQFFYHPPTYQQLHVHGKTKWQMFKELDFVGIFLFIAGSVLFLVGLSWGGQAYPWVSAPVLCTIIIGIFTLAGFVVYEGYFCKTQPFMPPRLFRNIGFDAIVVIAAIGAMIYYSLTVLWPQIITSLYTTDSIKVGLQSSVVGGGILLGQVLGGCALTYIPKVKFQVIIAACLSFAFITPLVLINADSWTMTITLGTLTCISIGYIDNISFPGVTLVVEPQDIGLATGVLGSIRALGGAVAQALYVSVFVNKLNENIPTYVVPAVTKAGLPSSSLSAFFAAVTSGDFSKVPGVTPAVLAALGPAMKLAYSQSFRIVFFCTIPFSVILIGASCLVPNMEKYLHNNVAKRLQGRGTGDVVEAKEAPVTVPGRGVGQVPKEMISADVQTVEKVDESRV